MKKCASCHIKEYIKDFLEKLTYDKNIFSAKSQKYFKLKEAMKNLLNNHEYEK